MNLVLPIIFVYIVITLITITHTYYIMKKNSKSYQLEVHSHMASIMMFHITIVSIILYMRPSILDNTYVSILNTMLSVMFSVLFYLTDKKQTKILYVYNTFYLVFASILVAEVYMYFDNPYYIISFSLIYLIFVTDKLFFTNNRRKLLLTLYSIVCLMTVIGSLVMDTNLFYAMLLSSIYALIIIGYMYYDYKNLVNNKEEKHLEDALKYFLDLEGMIVRTIDTYFTSKQ